MKSLKERIEEKRVKLGRAGRKLSVYQSAVQIGVHPNTLDKVSKFKEAESKITDDTLSLIEKWLNK